MEVGKGLANEAKVGAIEGDNVIINNRCHVTAYVREGLNRNNFSNLNLEVDVTKTQDKKVIPITRYRHGKEEADVNGRGRLRSNNSVRCRNCGSNFKRRSKGERREKIKK